MKGSPERAVEALERALTIDPKLAVAALTLYCLFTLAGVAAFGFTLTLPGMAGFVLSIGIATSVFTAVTVVRLMASRWLAKARPASLSI